MASSGPAASAPAHVVPLVGRRAERELIRRAVSRAADGTGQAVLVTGEPGIGKTALLAAAVADARSAGCLVLSGRAHEAERGIGYAPVVDAFGADLGLLGARRASALVQGLPELGRLFSGVPAGRVERHGDPAVERWRLVDAVARLCERVAAGGPLMLVLDDLQWADGATLQLVHHLVRRLEGDRFLLVGAARVVGPEQGADAEFVAFRDSIRRLGLVEDLVLRPLGASEVAEMLRHLLPEAPPSDELVAQLVRRSGGVPLFVEALARSLVESDGTSAPVVGPQLRSVLDERLARLAPQDRAVLDLLAVHAAPLPHRVLLAASGSGEQELLASIVRMVGAGVVTEEDVSGTVAYAVSHALLGEAAVAGLPAVSRQRLHLALADAMVEAAPAAEAAARHLLGAGVLVDDGRVVPALVAAGEAAGRRGDQPAAAAAWGEVVARLRRDPSATVRDAMERWAEALYRTGRAAEAADAWQECLSAESAQVDPDRGRVATLHHQLAAAARDRGRLDAAAAHLGAAVTAARGGSGGAASLAEILADRFALAERCEDLPAAHSAAAELAELAARTDDAAVVVEARVTRALLDRARGHVDAAGAAAGEALAAARRTGSAALELRALGAVLEVAVEAGAAETIRTHADQALALARRLGSPALELRSIGSRAAAGVHDGNWSASDRDIARTLALSRRFEVPRSIATVLVVRGLLQIFRGDLAAAESTIGDAQRELAGVAADRHVAGDVALARARLALARGADATLAELVPTLLSPGGRNLTWRLLTAAEGLCVLRRYDDVGAVVELLGAGAPNRYRAAVRDWTSGLAHAGVGDPAGVGQLLAAADSLSDQGRPYWAALARLAGAEACSDDAAARAHAEVVLDAMEGLGARRDADRARRLLRRLGARPRPARRPTTTGGPLSARELEVTRLFAEGLTTAEVAARLVLSPHTVTAHLRRIYERLGVRSRASLTRILADQGLLADD